MIRLPARTPFRPAVIPAVKPAVIPAVKPVITINNPKPGGPAIRQGGNQTQAASGPPQRKPDMPFPLVAAAGVAKFVAGGGLKKVGNFIGGLFGKKKAASPVAVAAKASASVGRLPVASSRIVYGDDPGAGTTARRSSGGVMAWIKDNTALAIGIALAVVILFGKQIKKLFR